MTLAASAKRGLTEYVGQRRNVTGQFLCAQRMRDYVLPVLGSRLLRELSRSGLSQLRHTFACRWLEAGGSKEALQKILGHSTIRLTERYGALSDDAVFAEAARLGRIPGTAPAQRPAQAG